MVNILTMEQVRACDVSEKNIKVRHMVDYLQSMMDSFMEDKERYGMDDYVVREMDAMIACKEMVEALAGYPINLRKDGKVTMGF